MPRPDDHAVLVGIQEYPGSPGFGALSGPVKDVEYFERWLVDPKGGDVDPANIVKLITQTPRPDVPVDQFPPTSAGIEDTIRALVLGGAGVIRRPEGRLYLYFSGHGFSDFSEKTIHAALYAANAQPFNSRGICGTKYANWCRRAAVFGEIVLVMDCCRDEELSKQVLPPPFDDVHDPALAKKVRVLEIYAVPYGGKAQERFFADVRSPHGLLTYALVAALYGAPLERSKVHGNRFVRSSHALKEFIEGCWGDIAGATGPESPEFVLPTKGEIAINEAPPRALPRRVVLDPAPAVASIVRVIDSAKAEAARVELDPAGGSAAYVYPGEVAPRQRTFDGSALEIDLRPEVYELLLESGGATVRSAIMPMAGDHDVRL